MNKKYLLAGAIFAATSQAKAITFNFTDTTAGGMQAEALAGFQQAADIWSSILTDNIAINFDIRFDGTLASNVLGSTSSIGSAYTYTSVRAALLGAATSSDDAIATAALPTGSSIEFLTNNTSDSSVYLDNDGSANNSALAVNNANAKALGLLGASSDSDGSIAFNSAFTWDFDQSDGIDAGKQDFVGVTVHEIGHALGFVSGVDTVDFYHGSGDGAGSTIDLDGFAIFSVWDLFRYSAAGQLDFSTGGDPYFSIDGGATSIATFSTGSANGDGNQASHWEDNLGYGLLDPTANPAGQINTLSSLDLRAFDVMGFAVIPEPSSILLGALSCLLPLLHRRR
ncbi:NF038122 family metalloprotease [Luteolibacter sp. AS25]|uniref:NF038122 family metalloprotease n=1 Tax=Luteolibacter sp. AS25 TaxID=3135776 RepID=UPI00398B45E7